MGFIFEDDNNNNLFNSLRLFNKGELSEYELYRLDSMVYNVKVRDPLFKSEITFNMGDSSELFKLLDIDEDDYHFLNAITNSYGSGWEFEDMYTVNDNFKEGYIIYHELNDENNKKLKEIIFLLTGKKINTNDTPETLSEFSELLIDMFPKEIESILFDYHTEKNREMEITAENTIIKELNEFLNGIGFRVNSNLDLITTTSNTLIKWYAQTHKYKLNFKELFKTIVNNSNKRLLGGWVENQFEFQNIENFDTEGFNRDVEYQLDKILEIINDETTNIKEYIDLIETITKKYKVDVWYNLPKNDNYMFKIVGFDREELKIKLEVKKLNSRRINNISISLDGFNKLLYQPELFDLSDIIPESFKKVK